MNTYLPTVDETDLAYHDAAYRGETVSFHTLKVFHESPRQYAVMTAGGIVPEDTAAMAFGRMAHCAILEPERFREEYLVSDGPVNPKTGEPYSRISKAYADWKAEQFGKEIVSVSEYDTVDCWRNEIKFNGTLDNMISESQTEIIVRAKLEGVLCQGRLDAYTPLVGIIDLKTCKSLAAFENEARRYKYLHQLAFYRRLMSAAHDIDAQCWIIACEKDSPHTVGYWQILPSVLDEAWEELAGWLRYLKKCRENADWPTGYEQPRVFRTLKYHPEEE